VLYFFDPDVGRRRRALVRDRAAHLARVVRDELEIGLRDAGNRVRGTIATTRRIALDVPDDRVVPANPSTRLAIGLVGAAAVLPFVRRVPTLLAARLLVLGALGSAVYGVERARRRSIAGGPARRSDTDRARPEQRASP
jgi:hypothetical protein